MVDASGFGACVLLYSKHPAQEEVAAMKGFGNNPFSTPPKPEACLQEQTQACQRQQHR